MLQQVRRQLNTWSVFSYIFVLLLLLPNGLIAVHIFTEPNENWQHIKAYVLQDYVVTTLILVTITGLAAVLIGSSLAWLISLYQFPLRNFFSWALILPLAVPPYIGAYAYHGLLNYTGLIQVTLRDMGIAVNPKYFDIMNIPGAIFIFTMFLFPYVYTITRGVWQTQSANLLENARLLGAGPITMYLRVGLPIARAALVGGVTLVALEVLNDYGVVKYFGIQTLTTAIFQTWFGFGDVDTALKLAGTLMMLVITVLILERMGRGRLKLSEATARIRPLQPRVLRGGAAVLACLYCFGIFALAFLIPVGQLVYWMFLAYERVLSAQFWRFVANSLTVAVVSATIILIIALIMANYVRLFPSLVSKNVSRVTTLGYSIPGAAIALAIIILFIHLDQLVNQGLAWFGLDYSAALRTSLIMLIVAYVVRFLAIGYQAVEAGFEKMGNRFTEAALMLGSSPWRTFFRVDLPLLKRALTGGFILVFIDILKELPLTLFLQPFNFATLATQAFKYAGNEMVHEAAISSLLIVFLSGICIMVVYKRLNREA
jgi:iron(III) transport system permease protein